MSNENLTFVRVDADHIDNLIKKDDATPSILSEDEINQLKESVEKTLEGSNYTVQTEAMDSKAAPFIITQPEFMRRMKEMQATGGAGMFGNFPEMYHLVVNTNSPLASKILTSGNSEEQKNRSEEHTSELQSRPH